MADQPFDYRTDFINQWHRNIDEVIASGGTHDDTSEDPDFDTTQFSWEYRNDHFTISVSEREPEIFRWLIGSLASHLSPHYGSHGVSDIDSFMLTEDDDFLDRVNDAFHYINGLNMNQVFAAAIVDYLDEGTAVTAGEVNDRNLIEVDVVDMDEITEVVFVARAMDSREAASRLFQLDHAARHIAASDITSSLVNVIDDSTMDDMRDVIIAAHEARNLKPLDELVSDRNLKVLNPMEQGLVEIALLMGKPDDWGSDTLSDIADIVHRSGLPAPGADGYSHYSYPDKVRIAIDQHLVQDQRGIRLPRTAKLTPVSQNVGP